MKEHYLLFGRSGQVGSAIAELFDKTGAVWTSVPWAQLAVLLDSPPQEIYSTLKPNGDARVTIICANGVTNPKHDPVGLHRSNVEAPQKIWKAFSVRPNARMLTIGSVMENFPELAKANSYLASKLELGEWVRAQHNPRLLHVQLHTVYGRALKPHMFLGQMAEALRRLEPFAMSSGEQLREYHHSDDIARSLLAILQHEWNFGSTLEVSSGHPLKLAEIAQAIFFQWKRPELLKIGALAGSAYENKKHQFKRSPEWLLPASREPMQGLINFLKEQL